LLSDDYYPSIFLQTYLGIARRYECNIRNDVFVPKTVKLLYTACMALDVYSAEPAAITLYTVQQFQWPGINSTNRRNLGGDVA